MSPMAKRSQVIIAVMAMMILSACAQTGDHLAMTPTGQTPVVTQPGCTPSKTQLSATGFSEVQLTTKPSGEMWALLFFDKAQAQKDEKFVWKISGSGALDIQAQYSDGTRIRPVWGPEYHPSSNWDRPGDEWGTGFNFPKAGCWTLMVTKGATVGEFQLNVLAP
jgi:hypothetical protein